MRPPDPSRPATCVISILAALVAGCRDSSDATAPLPSATVARAAAPAVGYLPYGVPVAVGQPVDRPPEPYDARKHGPAVPNTSPQDNLVGRPGVDASSLPPSARTPPTPRPAGLDLVPLPNTASRSAAGAQSTGFGPAPSPASTLFATFSVAGPGAVTRHAHRPGVTPSPPNPWYGWYGMRVGGGTALDSPSSLTAATVESILDSTRRRCSGRVAPAPAWARIIRG